MQIMCCGLGDAINIQRSNCGNTDRHHDDKGGQDWQRAKDETAGYIFITEL